MVALCLSVRHMVPITVDLDRAPLLLDPNHHQEHNNQRPTVMEARTLRNQYPAFRPVADIRADDRIMDGFIPTLFFQQVLPSSY